MSYTEPDFVAAGKSPKGIIQCTVEDGIMTKREKHALFVLFAQNNLRNVPMRLTRDDKTIKAKLTFNNIIFGEAYETIFFTKRSGMGYNWKWHARGRAPVSPIVPVAGQKVESVKTWGVLHLNGQQYISDTITIQIQE